jgi:hypothetical protein
VNPNCVEALDPVPGRRMRACRLTESTPLQKTALTIMRNLLRDDGLSFAALEDSYYQPPVTL